MSVPLLFTTCPLCMGNGCEDCDHGGDWGPATPEQLAREFHTTYERLAPTHGHPNTPFIEWADLPEGERDLMIATARELLLRMALKDPRRPELREFRSKDSIIKAWDDGWEIVQAAVQGVEWTALMKREPRQDLNHAADTSNVGRRVEEGKRLVNRAGNMTVGQRREVTSLLGELLDRIGDG